MKFFFRCAGVFIGLWLTCIIVGNVFIDTAHVMSKSVLFGGVLSIWLTVFYGWFDEAWIQHGRSRKA